MPNCSAGSFLFVFISLTLTLMERMIKKYIRRAPARLMYFIQSIFNVVAVGLFPDESLGVACYHQLFIGGYHHNLDA